MGKIFLKSPQVFTLITFLFRLAMKTIDFENIVIIIENIAVN